MTRALAALLMLMPVVALAQPGMPLPQAPPVVMVPPAPPPAPVPSVVTPSPPLPGVQFNTTTPTYAPIAPTFRSTPRAGKRCGRGTGVRCHPVTSGR